jgi:hypothetical protein
MNRHQPKLIVKKKPQLHSPHNHEFHNQYVEKGLLYQHFLLLRENNNTLTTIVYQYSTCEQKTTVTVYSLNTIPMQYLLYYNGINS